MAVSFSRVSKAHRCAWASSLYPSASCQFGILAQGPQQGRRGRHGGRQGRGARGRQHAQRRGHHAGQVRRLQRATAPSHQHRVSGHFGLPVPDAHRRRVHLHPHLGADQLPRDAVAVAVDLDAGVAVHPSQQAASHLERGALRQRAQRRSFRHEAIQRALAGAGHLVHNRAHVGHLAQPAVEVGRQRRPGGEPPPGQGVALDVADHAFVFAFGARPGESPSSRRTRAAAR